MYREGLISAFHEWFTPIAIELAGQSQLRLPKAMQSFMGMLFNVDLTNYNPLVELSGALRPAIDNIAMPMLNKYLAEVPDDQIPVMANSIVDGFIAQAKEKGEVNVFGIPMTEVAFVNFKQSLSNHMPCPVQPVSAPIEPIK